MERHEARSARPGQRTSPAAMKIALINAINKKILAAAMSGLLVIAPDHPSLRKRWNG
jgi:hypothetical protein